MSSQSPQHHNRSHFWSGFSLGAVLGVSGVYFFGTKKGRKNLHRALELTENLEETVEKVMGGVGEEYVEGLAGSETIGRDREVETGSVLSENESLMHQILRTAVRYFEAKQSKVGH